MKPAKEGYNCATIFIYLLAEVYAVYWIIDDAETAVVVYNPHWFSLKPFACQQDTGGILTFGV